MVDIGDILKDDDERVLHKYMENTNNTYTTTKGTTIEYQNFDGKLHAKPCIIWCW